MDNCLNLWLHCSYFARFFADLTAWWETERDSPVWPFHNGEIHFPQEHQQAYDDLFCGTCADIYIPLWASLCKRKDGSLLDGTTLAVIREYRRFGYAPVDMGGNPPDYIGQQFRFVSYLMACALHAERSGQSSECYLKETEDFFSEYLLDTARTVADGIKLYSESGWLRHMAEQLQLFCRGQEALIPHQKPEAFRPYLECFDAYLNGASASSLLAPPETVNTAGRNNCGGRCAIRVTRQEGCITGLQSSCSMGDPPLRMCVRGQGYRKTYMSGQRLRYPMKRIGQRGEGHFQKISWEEAVGIIAEEWARIKASYGPGARYVNYSTGSQGVLRPDHLVKRLLNADGGRLDYYGTYSNLCANYVTPYIYGDIFSGNSVEDILNTKLLILWGHNPSETISGSQRGYITALAREKGTRVIVIDPRRSDTAVSIADEWIGIRPSTDGALADAMAYVIWSEGLQDQHFMDAYCVGFDRDHMPEGVPTELNYYNYLFGKLDGTAKTPEWAERITGVPAATIRQLAREYATTKPACLLPGLGNQRIGNGEQTVRGMAALTCMTGNVGIPGGSAAGASIALEEPSIRLPLGDNAYPGVISCFLWTKAIEDGIHMTKQTDHIQGMERLESNIRMIFNLAGNTLINQHSDVNNTVRILKDTSKCEFIVCSDVFMTPSARFADILLPAPSFLEDEDIVGANITGHYLLCCNPVIDPLFACRNEYDWLSDLAKRLGLWETWSEGRETTSEWLEYLYAQLRLKKPELPEYEVFRERGGYTYRNSSPYIAYEKQIRDPEHYKFSTPSGKIEICSKQLYDMKQPERIPALPIYTPCPEGPEDPLRQLYPLQLIGWHTKRRCHSIHDNNPWLDEVERQCVWIHPEDAAKRGVADQSLVAVFNDRGRIELPAKVTDRIIPGVVAIPQGAWYTPDSRGIDIRGCINTLTSTRPTPLAKGNPQHTCLVEVVCANDWERESRGKP